MEDDSIPEVTEVNVLNKIKSKTTRIPKYKFKLSPWGPFQNNKNVTVRYDLFEIIEPGENVHVCVYKGLFNIPWYIVIE
jgi:hypothetical protein